jgi:EAL and modified HD-GYP domain-containing signal transduction protein
VELDDSPATGYPVHIARQAIYDRAGDVVAYELLFRDAPDALSSDQSGTHATSRVMVAAFTEFGLRELVGERACFINVPREFLVGDLPVPFDAAQVGLEILGDVPVDAEVLAGVAALAEQGYTIAVADFAPGQDREALLDYANYAKIDLLDGNVVRARATVALCRQYRHVQLIAQRLETPGMLMAATNLGVELFQGHVLGRPHVVSARTLGPARLHRLQVLAQLSEAEPDMARVIATVQRDPALSMRVLRAVNAAANGLPRTVSSIEEAVVLVGSARLRQWVLLMLAADLTDGDEGHLQDVLISARFCQSLAERDRERTGAGGREHAAAAFTLGLLTAVADVLEIPLPELIERLPLSEPITAAVLGGDGPLAGVLAALRAYRRGDVPAAGVGFDFLAAMRWSTASLQHSAGPGTGIGRG